MYQNLKVRSGNRTLVLMDNQPVGLIQSVRASDDYGLDAASGIGDAHAVEYVAGMARHTLSVSTMALRIGSMRSLGITDENVDSVLKGLVFDFQTLDKDSGAVLFTYISCKYGSGDTEVSKHAILVSSATFMALDRKGTAI